jgi:hypothetical protein
MLLRRDISIRQSPRRKEALSSPVAEHYVYTRLQHAMDIPTRVAPSPNCELLRVQRYVSVLSLHPVLIPPS